MRTFKPYGKNKVLATKQNERNKLHFPRRKEIQVKIPRRNNNPLLYTPLNLHPNHQYHHIFIAGFILNLRISLFAILLLY